MFTIHKFCSRRVVSWSIKSTVSCSFRFFSAGPLDNYKILCDNNQLKHDPHQERAVVRLDQLHKALSNSNPQTRGLYMHAGVGRGKTMIMDLFCTGIPDMVKKDRVHYHEFMLSVHKKLYKNGGVKDPMELVASEIAKSTQILCLDELEIIDVADAFVTRALFEKLWSLGVVTVFTTNCVPEALYKGGINRNSFVPFIGAIHRHCDVVCVDPPQEAHQGSGEPTATAIGIDYRAASDPLVGTTFCTNMEQFSGTWDRLHKAMTREKDDIVRRRKLWVSETRSVTVPTSVHGMAQFSFDELCVSAIGNTEFLALTEPPSFVTTMERNAYSTPESIKNTAEVGIGRNSAGFCAIFLHSIPMLSLAAVNDTRRFINLIDLLYERNILLVMHVFDDSKTEMSEPSHIFQQWLVEIYGEEGAGDKSIMNGHIQTDSNASSSASENIEWSTAGYTHPKAAKVANDPTFTHRAIARTLSRLNEMCGEQYLKNWEKRNEKHVKMVNLWMKSE